MLKPLILTLSITSSLVVGSVLADQLVPEVENTVSYTSVENVLKNALLLSNLGDISPVLSSFNELIKDNENIIYSGETIKYRTDTSCYSGALDLAHNKYIISVC